MRVEELATYPAVTCEADAPLEAVARQMKETDVGCVVVIDSERRPVGICTDRDLVVRGVANGVLPDWPVQSIMSRDVATVGADTDVLRAGEIIGSWAYRRLPVIDDDGRVIAVFSVDDFAVLLAAEIDRVAGVVRTERRAHAPR
jgi:CBS domain-containing protein